MHGSGGPGKEISAREVLAYSALLMAGTLPYLDILLHGYFLSDDFELLYIARNLKLHQLITLEFYRAFPWPFIRPVAILFWKANYLMYGMEPGGYYLTNLVLHLANTVLAAAIVQRLSKSRAAGFAAGLIFTLHPSHPDAVSFLSGRFDLACALFYLAGFLAYTFSERDGKLAWKPYAASLLFFVLALFSKEMALTMPAALLIYEATYGGRSEGRWRKAVMKLLPFFAFLPLYFLLRYSVFHGIGGYKSSSGASVHTAIPEAGTLLSNLYSYITTLVLGINWSYPKDFSVYAALILVVFCAGAVILISGRNRNTRTALFLVAVTLVTFVPVIGFSAVYTDLLGARYMYLPSAFFAGMLGVAFFPALPGKRVIAGAAAVSVFVLSVTYYSLLRVNNEAWVAASRITRSIPEQFLKIYPEVPRDTDLTFYDVPARLLGTPVYFENPRALQWSLYFAYGCPDDAHFKVSFKVLRIGESIPAYSPPEKGFDRKAVFYYDKQNEELKLVYRY